jgi:RimJ/RimL family protein N-acetyltransferase
VGRKKGTRRKKTKRNKPEDGIVAGDKVRLRDKKLSDVRNDYTWQTDPELIELDAAESLTMSFPTYLLEYATQIHYCAGRRFAVETADGKHIGNCTYYDVNEDRGEAELGIMIGDRDYWNKGYGTDAVAALVNHIFLNTKLERIHLKTLDWNLRAQRCFEKCGFKSCGRLYHDGYSFVVMELYRRQWEEQHEGLKT